jgi:hypothetical protein
MNSLQSTFLLMGVSLGIRFVAVMSCNAAEHGQWNAITPKGPVGPTSVAVWKENWPNCKFEDGVSEGHLEILKQASRPYWRVTCMAGEIGPEQGGVGWRWPMDAPETNPHLRQSAELRYAIRFEPGFEFVKGGKLPGLCGGPKTITGGDTCTGYDGWSVRLMWRREGRGQAYVYHPKMKSQYGDEFDFPDTFRFPVNQPIRVRIEVTMNSKDREDGSLRVWIGLPGQTEQLMVEQSSMLWTKDPVIGVDSVLLNVFHGGNDSSWAPSNDCFISFAEMEYR